MKGIQKTYLKWTGLLASLALFVANASYGTTCAYWFHQPKMPERVRENSKNRIDTIHKSF